MRCVLASGRRAGSAERTIQSAISGGGAGALYARGAQLRAIPNLHLRERHDGRREDLAWHPHEQRNSIRLAGGIRKAERRRAHRGE